MVCVVYVSALVTPCINKKGCTKNLEDLTFTHVQWQTHVHTNPLVLKFERQKPHDPEI